MEGRRFPLALVATTVAVTLVHYTDNYLNFDLYPQEGGLVEISRDLVWISWLAFVGFAIAGWMLWRHGRIATACMSLAVFSISGLISPGHYTADGMSELAAWRHAFIWVDFLLGAAVLAFAVRTAARPPAPPPRGT